MRAFGSILWVTCLGFFRDKILYAFFGVAFFLLVLVPIFSLFSMRQVQELSITLSLSAISIGLLLLAIFLGATSIWRDIERRYVGAVFGLPLSRLSYVLGKFSGIALFLLIIDLLLGIVAALVIHLVALQQSSGLEIVWLNFVAAIVADGFKAILVAEVALLFSSLSTSFFLPFFGTFAVYVAGSASQEVIDFVRGDYGQGMASFSRVAIEGLYYLLPNLAVFDLKVQAIYGLSLDPSILLSTISYFVAYTGILLSLAILAFNRRELV